MTEKIRVLFVCLGNSCRSQMAEAFARLYGSDVMIPASAGLAPAMAVSPATILAMTEKNADLSDHFPKDIRQLARAHFDLVVNLSGQLLPEFVAWPARNWMVADPISMDYDEHCAVRDQIERLVMELIQEMRREQRKSWLERRRI